MAKMWNISVALIAPGSSYLQRLYPHSPPLVIGTQYLTPSGYREDVRLHVTEYSTLPQQQHDAYIVFYPTTSDIETGDAYTVHAVDLRRTNAETLRQLQETHPSLTYVCGRSLQDLASIFVAITVTVIVKKRVALYHRGHMAAWKIQRWFRRWYYTPNWLGFSPYINSTYDALTKI